MSDTQDNRQTPRDHNLNDLFAMVRQVLDEQTTLKMQHGELSGKFVQHMRIEEQHQAKMTIEVSRLADVVESLTALHQAFPHTSDGINSVPDLQGHRAYHEELMTEAQERAKTVDRIKAKAIDMVVSGVIIGTVVIVGIGAQSWLKTWLAQ